MTQTGRRIWFMLQFHYFKYTSLKRRPRARMWTVLVLHSLPSHSPSKKSLLFEAQARPGPPPQTSQESQICDCSLTSTLPSGNSNAQPVISESLPLLFTSLLSFLFFFRSSVTARLLWSRFWDGTQKSQNPRRGRRLTKRSVKRCYKQPSGSKHSWRMVLVIINIYIFGGNRTLSLLWSRLKPTLMFPRGWIFVLSPSSRKWAAIFCSFQWFAGSSFFKREDFGLKMSLWMQQGRNDENNQQIHP